MRYRRNCLGMLLRSNYFLHISKKQSKSLSNLSHIFSIELFCFNLGHLLSRLGTQHIKRKVCFVNYAISDQLENMCASTINIFTTSNQQNTTKFSYKSIVWKAAAESWTWLCKASWKHKDKKLINNYILYLKIAEGNYKGQPLEFWRTNLAT